MPAMLRWNKKAKKIAFKILGPPENLLDQETSKQKKTKKELLVEDGQWAR